MTFLNSADDWSEHAKGVDEDLDNFERYIWPVYQKRGYSKEVAAVLHFINLFANEMLEDDEEDDFR